MATRARARAEQEFKNQEEQDEGYVSVVLKKSRGGDCHFRMKIILISIRGKTTSFEQKSHCHSELICRTNH
jgi:hypothetical protein